MVIYFIGSKRQRYGKISGLRVFERVMESIPQQSTRNNVPIKLRSLIQMPVVFKWYFGEKIFEFRKKERYKFKSECGERRMCQAMHEQ